MNWPAPAKAGTGHEPGRLDERSANVLLTRGISLDFAAEHGVRSVQVPADLPDGCPDYWTTTSGYLPGLLFPWRSIDGSITEWQLRPHDPPTDKNGDVRKYVFRKDAAPVLALVRDGKPDGPLLIVEGTCQSLAAAEHAPEDVTVLGIAGCWQWMHGGVPLTDLATVDGRDVFIALDADAASNLNVYTAGAQLRDALDSEGAASVRFLRVPGGKKVGVDDVLAQRQEERRSDFIVRLMQGAKAKPADVRPKAKRASDADSNPFFGEAGLLVQKLAEAIERDHPAALTRERTVALFAGGAFRRDVSAITAATSALLGDDYRIAHRSNVEDFLTGSLYSRGRLLPDRVDRPLLNVRNGMLDLVTGELLPHDPQYLSATQFSIEWDEKATCPTYDAWSASSIGDQLDDLEESVSAMLDPSRTPTKAVFLFGPSRSGKSTYLRLMRAVAGDENTSAVSLHQLAENRFAAANVYGKSLNVSADLHSGDVEDLSLFKMMTGEDLITADRKYGQQFAFTNRALFAFSANELPSVGESSRAYSERIKPFEFGESFAGREDGSLEDRLHAELPGILARWVRAWQRRNARGAYLPTKASVRDRFEEGSDRVRQFVAAACTVHEIEKATLPNKQVSTKRELHREFLRWADEQRGGVMGQGKFVARLLSIPGVRDARTVGNRRGLNVSVLPQELWGEDRSTEGAKGATSGPPSPDVERTDSSEVENEKCSGRVEGKGQPAPSAPDAVEQWRTGTGSTGSRSRPSAHVEPPAQRKCSEAKTGAGRTQDRCRDCGRVLTLSLPGRDTCKRCNGSVGSAQ